MTYRYTIRNPNDASPDGTMIAHYSYRQDAEAALSRNLGLPEGFVDFELGRSYDDDDGHQHYIVRIGRPR